ncbi:MAG: tRNA epoxyqueuosine(34) reductase QueG [Defluviimonas denitrificans]
MLAEVYTPEGDPLAVLDRPDRAVVSAYAQGRDYHDLVKKRLKRVGRWLIEAAAEKAPVRRKIKVFVDTAPVMEKPLAQAAGAGLAGQAHQSGSRELGSWFFLGAIFTTLDLPVDGTEVDHCYPGPAGPVWTSARRAHFRHYQLDARRCISYLTIEHKGPVDEALRGALGSRIYGCDDCLAVCPWNKFAVAARGQAMPRG